MKQFVLLIPFLLFDIALGGANRERQLSNQNKYLQLKQLGGLGGGGGTKGMKNEENLRKAGQFHFKQLDEAMIIENQVILDAAGAGATEFNDSMNETIDKIADSLDKLAFRLDWNFTKVNENLQEERYYTSKTTLIIVLNEIRRLQKELKEALGHYYRMKNELPQEDESCGQYFSCKECLSDDKCGWCPLDEKCVEGDEDSPLYTGCAHYSYKFCQGKTCLKYDACNTCLSDPDCGWCQVDEESIAVCLQQPSNFQGCPEGHWYHIESRDFRCPRKTKQMQEQEEVQEVDFWMRGKKPPKVCKKISQKDKEKAEQKREKYQDMKNEFGSEQNRAFEAKQRQLEAVERRLRGIRLSLEKLERRKEELELFIEWYREVNLIESEEETPPEEEEKKEEQQREAQQQPEQDGQGGGQGQPSEKKGQVSKKQKEEKTDQGEQQAEETPMEVENEEEPGFEEVDLEPFREASEEATDIEFEMAEGYKVDIGYHERKKQRDLEDEKRQKMEEQEDKKYKDVSNREIEGTIDMKKRLDFMQDSLQMGGQSDWEDLWTESEYYNLDGDEFEEDL